MESWPSAEGRSSGILPGRVAVLGLGNVLMGDDAAGPHVLRLLEAGYALPAEVELLDLGTPGPELAHVVEGREALVVVDTVRVRGGEAGELRLLRRERIVSEPAPVRTSPHDPSLRGALVAAGLLGSAPDEVLLVGIVPGKVELGIGLTPEVCDALPGAVAEVVAELARLGVAPVPRPEPLAVAAWWERGGAEDR